MAQRSASSTSPIAWAVRARRARAAQEARFGCATTGRGRGPSSRCGAAGRASGGSRRAHRRTSPPRRLPPRRRARPSRPTRSATPGGGVRRRRGRAPRPARRRPGPGQVGGRRSGHQVHVTHASQPAWVVAMSDPDLAKDIDACCRLSGEFTSGRGRCPTSTSTSTSSRPTPPCCAGSSPRCAAWSPRTPTCSAGSRWAASRSSTVLSAETGLRRCSSARRPRPTEHASSPRAGRRRPPGGAGRGRHHHRRRGARRDRQAPRVRRTVDVVVCAIDRSPEGEHPLADVGLEVRPVLTKAALDAARALIRQSTSWPMMSRSGRPSWSRSSASGAVVRFAATTPTRSAAARRR